VQEPVLVEVVRSGMVESRHRGSVVGLDAGGAVALRVGDVDVPVYGRSANKPLQATGMVELGLDLSPPQLALVCASHNGQPAHVAGVRAILASAGLDEGLLQNTPAYPLHEPSAADVIRAGGRRAAILQNCSGKHAGMLLACVRAGWDPTAYLRPGHPLQRRVRRAVLVATGLEDVKVGVDGCGVPVHGMPLRSMATLFARLTAPERLGELGSSAARAVEAMRAEPYLVGGRHSYDTELMRVSGDVVAKRGAEALECAAILPSGLGVAVKIDDGGSRAGAPALIATLRKLGGLSPADVRELAPFALPPVAGGDRTVGHLEIAFDLRSTGRQPTTRTVRRT
jgi:L-asparaginase II